jgi:citrate lyase subunit beta/citryl-CoA lyase
MEFPMVTANRPRRSMLYMPASNARALEKAKTIAADSLIFDLEDAVAPDAKHAARDNAVAAAKSKAYGQREVLIRANGLDTEWGADDLAAIAQSNAHGVVVPKVDAPEDIRKVAEILDRAAAPPAMTIWAMMETPRGVLAADQIAAVNGGLKAPRLAGYIIGANDLAKSLRCDQGGERTPLLYALERCILAARAYGLSILDSAYGNINDADGFAALCRQARAMGFDGKTLIHPNQVAVANQVFAPSAEDLDLARRMIAAFREAKAQGKGVATLDGKMVENLHAEEAERLIAQGEAIAALEQAST